MGQEDYCFVEKCLSDVYAKGFCSKHYHRFNRNGNPNDRELINKTKYCSDDSCNREASARGVCNKHYKRWYRGKRKQEDIREYIIYKMNDRCLIENCTGICYASRMCQKHYSNYAYHKKVGHIETIQEYQKMKG